METARSSLAGPDALRRSHRDRQQGGAPRRGVSLRLHPRPLEVVAGGDQQQWRRRDSGSGELEVLAPRLRDHAAHSAGEPSPEDRVVRGELLRRQALGLVEPGEDAQPQRPGPVAEVHERSCNGDACVERQQGLVAPIAGERAVEPEGKQDAPEQVRPPPPEPGLEKYANTRQALEAVVGGRTHGRERVERPGPRCPSETHDSPSLSPRPHTRY